MSAFSLELIADPELWRLAQQAREEAFAAAVAEDRRYTREEVEQRLRELLDWRKRAVRAEARLAALTAQRQTPDMP